MMSVIATMMLPLWCAKLRFLPVLLGRAESEASRASQHTYELVKVSLAAGQAACDEKGYRMTHAKPRKPAIQAGQTPSSEP